MNYSGWSAPIVYQKMKNSKIKFCADYFVRLNESLKTLNYPPPFPENIFANLNGGKFFSKIDFE